MSKTVAVIFGGTSNENEISIITGTMTANVLKKGGDGVVPVYITQGGAMYTDEKLTDIENFKNGGYLKFSGAIVANGGIYALNKRGKIKKFIAVDAAVNCCHGGDGESGAVCGLCALAGIPLASAGIFESSAFIDKYITKLVLSSLGVEALPYAYMRGLSDMDEWQGGFPAIVKPVSLGSSIGVERVENREELYAALQSAFTYDGAVIVERCVENLREINCAAYFAAGEVVTSECEEVFSSGGLLTFEDKYEGGGQSRLPAEIPVELAQKIKDTVKQVYKKLNMRGIVRFDFIVGQGKVYVSEVNTVPGSLSYYLLSGGFNDFYSVLSRVIEQALSDFRTKRDKKLLWTGILENVTPNACKRGAK